MELIGYCVITFVQSAELYRSEWGDSYMTLDQDELISNIGSAISVLHWEQGCKHCPISDYCKKHDNDQDMQCPDIWAQYIRDNCLE